MPRMYTRGSFKYVFEADREEEKPAKFSLKTLDPEKEAKLEDDIVAMETKGDPKKTDMRAKSQKAWVEFQILRHGLEGWEDWFRNGEEVTFVHPGASLCHKDNIAQIHPDDRPELANAITEGNSITEDDAKNSQSAPGSE